MSIIYSKSSVLLFNISFDSSRSRSNCHIYTAKSIVYITERANFSKSPFSGPPNINFNLTPRQGAHYSAGTWSTGCVTTKNIPPPHKLDHVSFLPVGVGTHCQKGYRLKPRLRLLVILWSIGHKVNEDTGYLPYPAEAKDLSDLFRTMGTNLAVPIAKFVGRPFCSSNHANDGLSGLMSLTFFIVVE